MLLLILKVLSVKTTSGSNVTTKTQSFESHEGLKYTQLLMWNLLMSLNFTEINIQFTVWNEKKNETIKFILSAKMKLIEPTNHATYQLTWTKYKLMNNPNMCASKSETELFLTDFRSNQLNCNNSEMKENTQKSISILRRNSQFVISAKCNILFYSVFAPNPICKIIYWKICWQTLTL